MKVVLEMLVLGSGAWLWCSGNGRGGDGFGGSLVVVMMIDVSDGGKRTLNRSWWS